jgi:biopolymer transport protein ExbD
MSLSRKPITDLVEPDLPITPMLDMSFQLLAFFIMTFRPMPTEGQIAVSFPSEPGGPPMVAPFEKDQPTRFTAKVAATEQGTIANISLREDNGIADKDLGTDVAAFLKELKTLAAAEQKKRDAATAKGQTPPPPPKLTIEVDGKLVQASVVQVFDAAIQAGFKDVATVPIDKLKR